MIVREKCDNQQTSWKKLCRHTYDSQGNKKKNSCKP